MIMIFKLLVLLLIANLASAFSFEAWSRSNFHGRVKTYTTRGTFYPGYNIASYRWSSPGGDGCCVRMCSGGGSVGYWCPSHSNGVPSARFNKIIIGCDNEQLVC
jgi:hypothetical protein